MVVLNTYPLGNQELLPFTVLISFRIAINMQLFSYSSFKIWYDFTIDEICSLHLMSLLQTYPSQTFMLLYRASHIWCVDLVYKTPYAFGVEPVSKRVFFLMHIPK